MLVIPDGVESVARNQIKLILMSDYALINHMSREAN